MNPCDHKFNQCDGCMAGHPLKEFTWNGRTSYHHEVKMPSGYNNGMVCQASRYGYKPFEGVPPRSYWRNPSCCVPTHK